MIKVIFLDVDGVINIPDYSCFNKHCLEHLKTIIEKTKAKVVISSSWRLGELETTKKQFPEWLQEHIVGETIRGYSHTIKGSSLPIVRGNEIKHWIDTHLIYPWHADPEQKEKYSVYDENGKFKYMQYNILDVQFTYVILDDDTDMLYDQRNHYIQTHGLVGIDKDIAKKAIELLNQHDSLASEDRQGTNIVGPSFVD